MRWSDQKNGILGSSVEADFSIRESYAPENSQLPFSMRGLKYAQITRNNVIMPLIIVENESMFEVRDSLLRQSRTDHSNIDLSKAEDKSDWTIKDKSLGSFIGIQRDSLGNNRRESYGGNDVEDVCLWINGESITESGSKGINQDINS